MKSTERPSADLNSVRADKLRLARLQKFLTEDPKNRNLAVDVAELAYQLGDIQAVSKVIQQWSDSTHRPKSLSNLSGLVLMRAGNFKSATKIFRELLNREPGDIGIRYNLAYAFAMQNDFQSSLDALDENDAGLTSAAAALKIRCLHHLHRLPEAANFGKAHITQNDSEVIAALALVALDQGDWDSIDCYFKASPETSEVAMARGFLFVDNGNPEIAIPIFEISVKTRPDNGRAWLGLGLARLLCGQFERAGDALHRGAGLLSTHLGAWIGAAWAYLLSQRYDQAEEIVAQVLRTEPRFSEAQGLRGLLEIIKGNRAEANRRIERALRLDRNCMTASLGRTMLLELDGQVDRARAFREKAVHEIEVRKGSSLYMEISRLFR